MKRSWRWRMVFIGRTRMLPGPPWIWERVRRVALLLQWSVRIFRGSR